MWFVPLGREPLREKREAAERVFLLERVPQGSSPQMLPRVPLPSSGARSSARFATYFPLPQQEQSPFPPAQQPPPFAQQGQSAGQQVQQHEGLAADVSSMVSSQSVIC